MLPWLLAALAPLLIYALWRLYLRAAIHREIAQVRRAGYPTTLDELSAWYPAPPAGQNAVPRFRAVFDNLYELPPRFRSLAPDDLRELRQAQKRVSEAVELNLTKDSDERWDDFHREQKRVDAILERLFPQQPKPQFAIATPEEREAARAAMDRSSKALNNLMLISNKQLQEEAWNNPELRQEQEKWLQVLQESSKSSIHGHNPAWADYEALQADAKRLNELPELLNDFLPSNIRTLSEDQRQTLRDYIENHAEGLHELHEIAAMPHWHFVPDFRNWFDHYNLPMTLVRYASQILHWEAIHHAEARDAEQATQAIEAAFHLARAIAQQPIAISELVRVVTVRAAVDAFEHTLNRVKLDTHQLSRITTAVEAADLPEASVRATAAERCITETSLPKPWTLPKTDDENLFVDSPWLKRFGRSRASVLLHRLSALGELDHLYALRMFRELIAALETPDPTIQRMRLNAFLKREHTVPKYYEQSSNHFHGALCGLAHSSQLFVPLTIARVTVAIEQYRLDHAQLPETLDQLVPQYLPTLPLDPANNEPLRYNPTETNYALYSVGRNQKDDGGPNENPKTDDIGLRIQI